MALDQFMFSVFEGIDRDKYLLVLYSLTAATSDALEKAFALVTEQTTGTWTGIPNETREVKERSMGRVVGVYEIPDYEREAPPAGTERTLIIAAAFPLANINGNLPELITVIYGNISMIGKLKVLDVWYPPAFLKRFQGPKFGIEGLRRVLGVEDRPLLCGMYKPCVGMLPATLGTMAYEMATGGVDIIKDDELLADPEFCPVDARIEVTERALQRAFTETGHRTIYTVNVTDRPDLMFEKARRAVRNGASALMVNVFTVGYGALQALAEDPQITVPIMGHPAFAGTFFEAPYHGLTSPLALGKFARLSGLDMLIYPSPYGKVPLMKDRAIRVAHELTAPVPGLKRVFPGPAAGMHPGTVAQSVNDFGIDLIVGAGGGLHGHPQGTVAGARAFHAAITAAIAGQPFAAAAAASPELNAAMKVWGDGSEPAKTYALLK